MLPIGSRSADQAHRARVPRHGRSDHRPLHRFRDRADMALTTLKVLTHEGTVKLFRR